MRSKHFLLSYCLCVSLLTSCDGDDDNSSSTSVSPSPTPTLDLSVTPTPSTDLTPSPNPSPTSSPLVPTPSPDPTTTPILTPTPSATPTPPPTPTLTPTETPTPTISPPQPSGNTTHPGPEVFQIGNAVSPILYYSTAWQLNDLFKRAGYEHDYDYRGGSLAFTPVINGQFTGQEQRELIPMDHHGWPTSMTLSNGTVVDEYWAIIGGGRYLDQGPEIFPAGQYELSWQGEGSIEVLNTTVVAQSSNRMSLNYDGQTEMAVVIRATDPNNTNNHLRNISLMRPDAVEGERFTRTYLDFIRPFTVIRPLHMTGEYLVYGPSVPWANRRPEDYGHWGGSQGAPYEVMIDLANQSNSDLWLNLPVAGDDEFFRNLADLTLQQLHPLRKVYIELGNEIWNFAPPYADGRDYALTQAEARWPGVHQQVRPWSDGDPVDTNMMINSWVGVRLSEACNLFKTQWGTASDRVVCVIAGQFGASDPRYFPNRFLLETPVYVHEEGGTPAGTVADAFAIAPYVGENLGPEGETFGFDQTTVDTYFDDILDYIRGDNEWADGEHNGEPSWRAVIRSEKAMAEAFNIPLVAYEGGNHFIGNRFTRDIVSVHPRMYEMYQTFFDVWKEEGGGLFVHFHGIVSRGQNEPGTEPGYFESENFGIIEYQTQPLEDAPKLRAVLEEIEVSRSNR